MARYKHYYVGPDVLDPASTGIENELVINDRHNYSEGAWDVLWWASLTTWTISIYSLLTIH